MNCKIWLLLAVLMTSLSLVAGPKSVPLVTKEVYEDGYPPSTCIFLPYSLYRWTDYYALEVNCSGVWKDTGYTFYPSDAALGFCIPVVGCEWRLRKIGKI